MSCCLPDFLTSLGNDNANTYTLIDSNIIPLINHRSQRMGYYNDDLKESDNDDYDGDWTDIGDSNDSSDNMPLGPQIGKLLLTGMKKKAVLMLLLGKEYYDKYIDRNTSINDDNDDDNDNARYSPLDYARRKFVAGVNLKKVLGLLPQSAVKERAILRFQLSSFYFYYSCYDKY